jgi:hypothetical protein
MPVRLTVDRDQLTELRNELKKIDPALLRALGKELKSELQPFANTVQGKMPGSSPLSNFNGWQDRQYISPNVKVAARPGAGWGKPFVLFTVAGAGNAIVEFAGKGKKSYVTGNRGRAMIRNLDDKQSSPGREGRFFFQAYKSQRRSSQQAVGKVLDRFADKALGGV